MNTDLSLVESDLTEVQNTTRASRLPAQSSEPQRYSRTATAVEVSGTVEQQPAPQLEQQQPTPDQKPPAMSPSEAAQLKNAQEQLGKMQELLKQSAFSE